jgi:hypothetical protein
MTRAAEAFERTLRELGFDEAELEREALGRRAALLAVSDQLWERELGPLATTSQVGELLHCSRQAVNERIHRGTILGLPALGGYAFPLFQFTNGGQTVHGISDVIRALSDTVETPYTIASWLVTPEPELDGRKPIERLRAGETGDAIAAAEHYADRLRQ